MSAFSRDGIVLRVRDVGLSFGDSVILRNVNADVHDIVRPGHTQGQVVALLGPSGIGKTQLFRIMSGLQKPTMGDVLLGSNSIPVKTGLVGVVAQNYPLFMHRSVIRNLLVAGRQANLDDKVAHEKASQLLSDFDLTDRASHYPAQLSGGQRQRVAIAQQMMCSEYFILMDEPFSGLDPLMKEKVVQLIHNVAGMHEHNTIIVVTHDIASAVSIADTIWVLGRDRDTVGKIIPGAYIKETFDLAEMGLAWRPDLGRDPRFQQLVGHINERFHSL